MAESTGEFIGEKQCILPKKKVETLLDHLKEVKCKELFSQGRITESQKDLHSFEGGWQPIIVQHLS